MRKLIITRRRGGIGRRPGLKIPWVVIPVPVRSRSPALTMSREPRFYLGLRLLFFLYVWFSLVQAVKNLTNPVNTRGFGIVAALKVYSIFCILCILNAESTGKLIRNFFWKLWYLPNQMLSCIGRMIFGMRAELNN